MPANQITNGFGTWNFVSIKGYPDLPGMQLAAIEKRGYSGLAFLEEAFRAEPTPIYCQTLVETALQKTQAIAQVKNLQGTQVTLYDACGDAYVGLVMKRVVHVRSTFVLRPQWLGVSYASGYRLQFSMVVQYPYGSF